MPFSISWLHEGRVVYAHVTGVMPIEEVFDFNTVLVAHVDAGIAPVHTVLHHDNIQRIPRDVFMLRRVLNILDNSNIGWIVHVSESRSPWLYVGLMLAKMTSSQGHYTPTIQEALGFLQQQDVTLPDLTGRVFEVQQTGDD